MQATLATNLIQERYSKDKNTSPNGVSCIFFPITSKWGIKTYTSRTTRDKTYDTQDMAADLGFGPEVGEKFDVNIDGEAVFCYITELAETLVNEEVMEKYHNGNYELWDEIAKEYQNDIDDLDETMEEKMGWTNQDSHIGNYGFLRGKLVVIDFGND